MMIIVAGICLALFGLLLFGGVLKRFGRLPGDIRYRGRRTSVFIPITSMLLLSVLLSLLLTFLGWLF